MVLIAELGPDMAHIEVIDEGADTVPRPRISEADDCTGRGLWLVSQLSAKWGYVLPARNAVLCGWTYLQR